MSSSLVEERDDRSLSIGIERIGLQDVTCEILR